MSIWGWFKSAFGGGALTNADSGEQYTKPTTYTNSAGVSVTDDRAMQISAVFACVRLLVQSAATLPLGFYRRTADGREPLPEDHQLVRLLKYKPNQYMSAKTFRQAMMTQRVLWGNAYAHIKRINGLPVSLVPLKPELMTVERDNNKLVYHYSTNHTTKKFRQEDIFHLKGFGDGIVGVSPLGYAREALGLSVSADQKAARSVNGVASAVLEVEGFPTDEQKSRLRELYGSGSSEDVYRSDGGLMITPGGLKYRNISMNPDDIQLLQSRQFQISEIARFFSVPVVMIDGAPGAAASWPASYEQQVLSFLTFGLKPYLEEWEDTVASSLLTPSERTQVFIEHKVEGLLRTDSAGRANFYSTMVQNGLMSRNEVRKKENMPAKEGADDLTVQVNLTPIEGLPRVNDQGNDHATSI